MEQKWISTTSGSVQAPERVVAVCFGEEWDGEQIPLEAATPDTC